MKSISTLYFLALLALAACGGQSSKQGSSTVQSPADTVGLAAPQAPGEAPGGYNKKQSARQDIAPFEAVLEDGKVRFTLSSPNEEGRNLLTVVPSGLEGRNDTLQLQVEGYVQEAFKADLNKDGFIEVYAVSISSGPLAKEHLYGFSSYRDRSYGPITLGEPQQARMMDGYQGQGRFYLGEDGKLKREFPLFDAAGQPSGSKRIITYELQKGETSFILEPVKSETIGN